MRYVVVGAGAVGGTVGGRLHDAGHDVVLVARGAHAAAMQRDGLRLALPDRVLTVRAPVVTSIDAVAFGPDDVVLLATKTQDTSAALDALVGVGADVPVVCVQNGVANERMALRRFDRVYGVVVMLPAVLLEPGRIDAQGHPFTGLLDLGRVPSGADEFATRIATDFSGSGFVSQPQPDIMRWKYAKLLRNLGNAIEALGGHDLDGDERAAVGELDRRLREEAIACLDAAGIAWTSDEEWVERRQEQVQHTPVEGRSRAGGSTWQSLARGAGSVEVDYLNGEICLLGREHRVPTPVNAMVQRVMTRAATSGAAPGSMRPTELLAQADIVAKESPDA
jgi:2-dehydropantoate 2-reductase